MKRVKVRVKVRVTGVKEVDRWLSRLEPKLRKKAFRKGTRAGAKVFATAARAEFPRDTGTAATAITVRASKTRKGRIKAVAVFKPDAVRANAPNGVFYPAIVEYGSIRQGRAPAAPMRTAYRGTAATADATARATITTETRRIVKGA
jgi:HK97 gp10 family phage protein